MCVDVVRLDSSWAGPPLLCTVLEVVPRIFDTLCKVVPEGTGDGKGARGGNDGKRTLNMVLAWPMRAAMTTVATEAFITLAALLRSVLGSKQKGGGGELTLGGRVVVSNATHIHPGLVELLLRTLSRRLAVCMKVLCETHKWSFDLRVDGSDGSSEDGVGHTTRTLVQLALGDSALLARLALLPHSRGRQEAQHDAVCALELVCDAFPMSAFRVVIEQHLWRGYVLASGNEAIEGEKEERRDGAMRRHRQAAAAVALCGSVARLAVAKAERQKRGRNNPEEAHASILFRKAGLDGEGAETIISMAAELREKMRAIAKGASGGGGGGQGEEGWDAGVVQAAARSLQLLED